MQHKFLLLCLIGGVAYFLIEQVSNAMLHDNNAIIRFLGYIVAFVTAIFVLVFILYHFFDINLLAFL